MRNAAWMMSVLAGAAAAVSAAPATHADGQNAELEAFTAELTDRIESQLIQMLPSEQRRGILFERARQAGCDVELTSSDGGGVVAWSAFQDPDYAKVSHIVTPELWERTAPGHRQVLVAVAGGRVELLLLQLAASYVHGRNWFRRAKTRGCFSY